MPRARAREIDVLVIGGGPAGATAAGQLASWGRSVVVVHAEPSHPSLAESLPAGVRKVFNLVGQGELVAAARFFPNDGNVASWAGRSTVTTSDVPGYHVLRARFDHVLRESARKAGAQIVYGRARRVECSTPFEVGCTTRSGAEVSFRARHLLDCSGRTGVVARRGLRLADAGYRTLAVAAEWECRQWPRDERTRTFVESYRDGWAWSVPLSPTRRQCTVMIDPDRLAVKTGLSSAYAAEIRKATGLGERLDRARQLTTPWACDASLYHAVRATDSGALLVGDAASFIEPLSSAGVKKALTSAWRAAVVVHTCLDHADMTTAACGLHESRERIVYEQCVKRSAAFFAAAGEVQHHGFWDVRARVVAEPHESCADAPSDEDLAADPEVRRAFAELRAAPRLRLRQGRALSVSPAPTIEGRHIVFRDALVVPGLAAPVRFVAGVNLPELARLASRCHDIPTLIRAYQSRLGAVHAGGLLTALSWLVARRLLHIDVESTKHSERDMKVL